MRWLFKTEPDTYSIDDLAREKKTAWSGIRNYQARNFLRECKKGDPVIVYHTGDDKSAVGLGRIIKEAYPEPDPDKAGDWVQVDLAFALRFEAQVPLADLKKNPALKDLLLIKQSRLSCMPVTDREFKTILELGGAWADFQKLK